jgi:formylmethanofuran dehydrogenase subunit E
MTRANVRKQKTKAELASEVARHTVGNRSEVEESRFAECLSCISYFRSREVVDWRDEWDSPEKQNRVKRWSAKCPRCGEATVIGDASGLLDDQAYAVTVSSILGMQKE